MALLPLVIAPDPRLKQKSQPVLEVDDALRTFMDDLLETMYHEQGIGLAAVQVGVHKRVLVMDVSQKEGEKEPIFMVNPEIVETSEDRSIYNEGCLSFPEAYSDVTRPALVTVRYLDYHGVLRELKADGLLATCVQHEIDHLNGIVFVDHLSPVRRDMIARKLRKVKKFQS